MHAAAELQQKAAGQGESATSRSPRQADAAHRLVIIIIIGIIIIIVG